MPSYRSIAVVLAIIAALMLLGSIAYPFGYDQAVYAVGGELVRAGKIPYRDFLDTKQPLIFYLFALAQAIFGSHEWSVRILDVLYQSTTAYYFYRILRRELSSELSLTAVALMVILYAGSGFWMTCEAESFAILPSVWLIDLTFRASRAGPMTPRRSLFWLGVFSGIAAGSLLLLKFTLVIGVIPAVFFILIRRIAVRLKRSYLSGIFLASTLFFGMNLLYQWWVGGLPVFWQSLGWLWHYGSIGTDAHSFLAQIFLMFPERIVYSASVLLTVLAITGIISARRSKVLAFRRSLLSLLLFTGFVQLFGVLLERKIEFPYQYTRALWAFTPFMALSVEHLAAFFAKSKASILVRTVLALCLILAVALLSPLTRTVTQTEPWVAIALSGGDRAAEVSRRIPDYFAEDQKQVASYFDSHFHSSGDLFFWGNDAGIYFFTHSVPTTSCITATPFRTAFTPPAWKTSMLVALQRNPPLYAISEFGDSKPYITGSKLDSYQSLLQWKGMESFLDSHYRLDTTIGHFLIFQRTLVVGN
ncbi:MAG TPA: glycosyltransferase family 39 protein [Candidatus Kapabacteria bacterium]